MCVLYSRLQVEFEGGLPFCDLYFEQSGPLVILQTHRILFKPQDLCPALPSTCKTISDLP